MSKKIDYRDAGVNIEAGYEAVNRIKKEVAKTYNAAVLNEIGSFGSFYDLKAYNTSDPILISGTDGVGTKLKLAFMADQHDTIGIDCVAMCVNDILCHGAKPLYFLDYIATGGLSPKQIHEIVKGMVAGCLEAEVALVGGETAEMPGFYPPGEYDVAGFATGIVDRSRLIDGKHINEGDQIWALPSSGFHSNGYSLLRKLFIGNDKKDWDCHIAEWNATLLETLLIPTKIYVKPILDLYKAHPIAGLAHITGGGLIENVPRMLPDGIGAHIQLFAKEIPATFQLVKEKSGLTWLEMANVFNLGIGMVVVLDSTIASAAIRSLQEFGLEPFLIGEAIRGKGISIDFS